MRAQSSLLALAAVFAWTARADACRCEQRTLEAYYASADIVLLADIDSVTRVPSTDDLPAHLAAAPRIVETFKGAHDIAVIKTAESSASCGIPLQAGQRYWVFAQRRAGDSAAWIDTCNGSRLADNEFSDIDADRVRGYLREWRDASPRHHGAAEPTP